MGLGLVVVAFGKNIVGGGVVRVVLRCGQDRIREGTTDLVGGEANMRRASSSHRLTWTLLIGLAFSCALPYCIFLLFIHNFTLMHQVFFSTNCFNSNE